MGATAIAPLHLPYISPTSPLHLPYISSISRPHISHISPQYLPRTCQVGAVRGSAQRVDGLGRRGALRVAANTALPRLAQELRLTLTLAPTLTLTLALTQP